MTKYKAYRNTITLKLEVATEKNDYLFFPLLDVVRQLNHQMIIYPTLVRHLQMDGFKVR